MRKITLQISLRRHNCAGTVAIGKSADQYNGIRVESIYHHGQDAAEAIKKR